MKRKDVLTILIPSLIVVLLWVIFSVYHNFVSSTIPVSVNGQISAISPNFDVATIETIKLRTAVEPIYTVNPITKSEDDQTLDLNSIEPVSSSSAKVASAGGELNQ